MLSISTPQKRESRPAGVAALASLCATLSAVGLVFAILIWLHAIPLSAGSVLLPGGMEQSGPISFLIYAGVLGAVSAGLWKGYAWTRRVAVLLAVAGIVLVIPEISSAVADGCLGAMAREALQIMVRVIIVYYLSQEPVRNWFAAEPD